MTVDARLLWLGWADVPAFFQEVEAALAVSDDPDDALPYGQGQTG